MKNLTKKNVRTSFIMTAIAQPIILLGLMNYGETMYAYLMAALLPIRDITMYLHWKKAEKDEK